MLLTIGIPTYNRACSLDICIRDFVSQIEQNSLSDLEIIVSDNCSIDQTRQICAQVALAYPRVHIRYFRNDTNVGFDRNVDALFQHARGKYVWTFSDDDRLRPGALLEVVELLRERDVRFAFVNYNVCVGGVTIASRFGSGESRWVDASEVLKKIKFSNSLVSSCIFSRHAWLEAGAAQYVGTLWIHFFMARTILRQGLGLIIGGQVFTMVQSSLEKSRAEKFEGFSDEIEFYMQAHLKFVNFASEMDRYGYGLETCALAESLGRTEDVRQVINYKLTSRRYSPKQIINTWKALAHFRWKNLQFWCVTTPLLFAPNAAVSLMRITYRKLKAWRI